MAILADKNTRLLVQGITGREGLFHTQQMIAYGTNVVGGVTPGKGGEWAEGKPVFDTVKEARESTGANATIIFVPPRGAVDSIYEAIDADMELIVCITEGIPIADMMRVREHLDMSKSRLIGANCPGLLTPGQAQRDADGGAIPNLLTVLEAARLHGVGKVVVALPAGSLYGDVPSRDLPVKESRAFEPLGVRGVLANTVTQLLDLYRNEHAVEHTALALSSVYGPRQRPGDGVVAAFASAVAHGQPLVIHGDGRQTRDLLYVDDAVDALFRAGQRGSGLVVNVGTGVQTSVRDLARAMDPGAEIVNVPRRHGDLTRIAVSPTRARIHLQWSPWTDLVSGLRSTIAAFG